MRFPGVISYVTPPGGGTTDYAVDIYYSAVRGERFVCPIKEGTLMDMIYMPDALKAAIMVMEADPARLVHRNAFNIASLNFGPETVYAAIKKYKPDFEMVYDIDPLKQRIADRRRPHGRQLRSPGVGLVSPVRPGRHDARYVGQTGH